GRDDYKPQYINFNNSLLVRLFGRMIGKAPASIKIEEMTPSSKELLSFNGEDLVSEFVVQWSC
ncbi:hypothetical protein, partial [Xanthovirga aplysinae]|uniref:hypothetical protein n=1 Tax=Xanthovirga aplysinae TaxID=2529853 RepID=UPI001CA398A6